MICNLHPLKTFKKCVELCQTATDRLSDFELGTGDENKADRDCMVSGISFAIATFSSSANSAALGSDVNMGLRSTQGQGQRSQGQGVQVSRPMTWVQGHLRTRYPQYFKVDGKQETEAIAQKPLCRVGQFWRGNAWFILCTTFTFKVGDPTNHLCTVR